MNHLPKIEDLHPELRDIIQPQVDSYVFFIKTRPKISLIDSMLGIKDPARDAIKAMRAYLECWGITNV